MSLYPEPIIGPDGLRLAGGWARFAQVRLWQRGVPPEIIPAEHLPSYLLDRLTTPRPDFAGLSTTTPRLMGVLNVTPDSFSDGGRFMTAKAVSAQIDAMIRADLWDVGAESTRPGADFVPAGEELARLDSVMELLPASKLSIDTRKADVAQTVLGRGVAVINDVSAGCFDPAMLRTVADSKAAYCLTHGPFDPATMQENPRYDNVVLDVFDFLEHRLNAARNAGIPDARLMIDPGIGFGKTLAHNLALLRALPLFHALGVPILLGISRKRLIGEIGKEPRADQRMPGTLALTLQAVAQGVQWHRVHDVAQIAQGLALWRAVNGLEGE